MPRRKLWAAWKRVAHRAAEIQSVVVLTVLYCAVVVPIGIVLRRHAGPASPAWSPRPERPVSRDDARRQS